MSILAQAERDIERAETIGSRLDERAAQQHDNSAVNTCDQDGKPRKQADILVDIGREHTLFHEPGGGAYARLRINGHNEVHGVASTAYRELLAERYLSLVGKGCNRNALTDSITTLSAMAKFRGEEYPVWLRTAEDGDDIVIDTGARDWTVIRITTEGWRLESGSAVMFRRAGKMLALPTPGASRFGLLWRYLNVRDEDKVLIAAFLLGALRPNKPYAPILLSGEQGTGKSTFSKLLKAIIDPSASPLRSPPKETRDLLFGALNSWLLCLDNLSYLPAALSDSLCRISTGGAISERTLYSNLDETLVEIRRPAILNGIEELGTRPDLAQRGIHIEPEPITQRRTEADLWRAFSADAPAIFAGLLDGLVMALRDVNRVHVNLPRMADFALWAEAGLPALGFERGEFSDAYQHNQNAGLNLGIESSASGRALLRFMQSRDTWTGTATDLLANLAGYADEGVVKTPAWPKSARGLRAVLNRLGPALRAAGLQVEHSRDSQDRLLTLCNTGKQPSQPSQPSFHDANDGHDGSFRGLYGTNYDGHDANDGSTGALHGTETESEEFEI
jgi:hypothetical protein